MYKKAIKIKLRFPSSKGALSTEELMDLPLITKIGPSLDEIELTLRASLKQTTDVSMITKTDVDPINEANQLRHDIVVDIIETKLQEQKDQEKTADRLTEINRIRNLIAARKQEDDKELPVEDLEKMLAKLL